MIALFWPMAWLVPPEEGGGVFSVLTVILMALAVGAVRWLQDRVWRRWHIDLGGVARRVAPLMFSAATSVAGPTKRAMQSKMQINEIRC